jgi:hypothetical protein
MKTHIVITDLTRMYRGMVCIAGYDAHRRCIRPTLPPPGIPETTLINDKQPIIFPFAVVEFDLLEQTPEPPHTEDQRFDPDSPRFIRKVINRQAVLDWSLFENIPAIFEQPINTDFGFYVMDCQGVRSLGTIHPASIDKVVYEQDVKGTWDYRLYFTDGRGDSYRLKITDLTWQFYCQQLKGTSITPAQISEQLTAGLLSSEVYLRIGLSRGWKRFPDRCFLQINGIYTFPDYLNGKTFADILAE